MGVATAIITKAGVVTGPGRTDTLPLDPIDVDRNQIRIPDCSFITFRMGVAMAEAIAVAFSRMFNQAIGAVGRYMPARRGS